MVGEQEHEQGKKKSNGTRSREKASEGQRRTKRKRDQPKQIASPRACRQQERCYDHCFSLLTADDLLCILRQHRLAAPSPNGRAHGEGSRRERRGR